MKYELIKWNNAKKAIAEAKTIDEVKNIRDKAEALRAYAKQVGESLEVQNDVCEIKLRAERRMGEMLKETELAQGKRTDLVTSYNQVTKPSLSDFGINKSASHRYQAIASLPENVFEDTIKEIKEDRKELTEVFLYNTARKIDRATKIQEQKEILKKEVIEQPTGKYDVIVIDPPWKVNFDYSPNHYMGRVANPYPEMSIKQIKNIQLPSKKDSILWLWTTHSQIWNAIEIMEYWGYEYKCILVWDKKSMGIGKWLRKQCEFCLLGITGKPIWTTTNVRDIIREQKTSHSTKPESFYKMVDKICYGRKLDYFGRKKRKGWDVYGDEV